MAETGGAAVDMSGRASSERSDEARITELEVKACFAEDRLDHLDRTVYRQQREIERLGAELAALRQYLLANLPGDSGDPLDERPPHY